MDIQGVNECLWPLGIVSEEASGCSGVLCASRKLLCKVQADELQPTVLTKYMLRRLIEKSKQVSTIAK